ncbi:MAG: ABC transporter substrate-binding protein [Hespellia sp.]|nr:ABC transporter substrate-binding protein [Hespellia sp.]
MRNKKSTVLIAVVLLILLTAGCAKQPQTQEGSTDAKENLSGSNYTIAISQFAEHPALEQCRMGFLEELAKAGIVEGENLTLVYQNAGAEKERAKLTATSFSSTDQDLIYCIGSTSAGTMLSAVRGKGTPIVFAGVSNPVAAELTDKDGVQRDQITGISSSQNVKDQLGMIHRILPDAKKVGIIYSEKEDNSLAEVEQLRFAISQYDMQLVLKPVGTVHDAAAAADALLTEADCILNIQDNLVTSQLSVLLEKAMQRQIPVFGSDKSQAEAGCLLAQGTDYQKAGREAAKLAIQILKGEKKASQLPIMNYECSDVYVNQKVADELGITLPETVLKEAEEIFDTTTEETGE